MLVVDVLLFIACLYAVVADVRKRREREEG